MNLKTFIETYREAFGEKAKLPLAFWYSESPAGTAERINGCMFKMLPRVHDGETVSLNGETVTCGGGKFYCGFTPMPERVPNFVSLTEKYKQTPQDVIEYVDRLQVPLTEHWLNFARIDRVESFDGLEGILFMATPDMLSGLATWAYFDNNDDSAVSALFGSGCAAIVTMTGVENRMNGRRTFVGGLDPSVRPWFGENELSYTIPMSRFREMYHTMRQSCLFDTHAWKKVRQRINPEAE